MDQNCDKNSQCLGTTRAHYFSRTYNPNHKYCYTGKMLIMISNIINIFLFFCLGVPVSQPLKLCPNFWLLFIICSCPAVYTCQLHSLWSSPSVVTPVPTCPYTILGLCSSPFLFHSTVYRNLLSVLLSSPI